ncbi:MAG TPA: GDSL-type esterase/lipase family protein [Candidatus Limnocylindria bacterium]|jgi:lysophospholipase L1-like esterase|nr:GDSL-type esterase/lipase family protein [Candidatus Limnocylindria bacterium]
MIRSISRRQMLSLLPAAALLAACSRKKIKPPIVRVEDYENRKGGFRPIRVACLGDSITFGAGVEEREKNNYPKLLGDYLGDRFEVKNFGRSGATLSRTGDLPYWTTEEMKAAQAFHPDVIILMLGTNDTKPQNWKNKKYFAGECRALIDTLRSARPKPKVWVCLPVPIYGNQWGITAETLEDGVIQALMEVSNDLKAPVIDLNDSLTGHPEMFPDKIHPNAAGAALMAKVIFQAIRP